MKKSVGRPKKLVAGKLPKEQYEIAKKIQQKRIDELELDPKYQYKMDNDLLNQYDFDYVGRQEMAQKRQKAMQSNPKLFNAWKRQNEGRIEEIKAREAYEREQERLRYEAEEKARKKANDPFSNIMSGLSTVASLVPGIGTAISSGIDVIKDGTNLIRDTTGGGLRKRGRPRKIKQIEEVKKRGRGRPKQSESGAGLIDTIKGVFSKRQEFNNISSKTLKQYGDYPIVKIQIARKPIMNILNKIINTISPNWNKLKKEQGYDKLMHLGMIVTVKLPSGQETMIMMEKVDAVTISNKISMTGDNVEYVEVPLTKQLTINEMVNTAISKVGKQIYFDYNFENNNCQKWLMMNLENSGLLTESVKQFIYQDLSQIASKMSGVSKGIIGAVTDLGQLVNKWRGAGLDVHAIKYKKPFDNAEQHFKTLLKSNKKKLKVTDLKHHIKIVNKKKGKFENIEKSKHGNIEILFGKLID